MDSLSMDALIAALVTGLLLHLIYNRSEPTLPSFLLNLISLTGIWALAIRYLTKSSLSAAWSSIIFLPAHLTALGLSIAAYRLFFHPLRRFPGPLDAKLTKLTDFYHSSKGLRHVWLPSLHAKYGEIVRIGPNELSFSSPGAVKYLHGPQGARLNRGPYYDARVSNSHGRSMPGTRDWEDHRIRRRIWDHGFSQKSLKSYEPRILQLLAQTCEAVAKNDGDTVDISAYCDYFAFDVMGDLAFNEPFGLLAQDGPRFYSQFVRKGMQVFSTLGTVPWLSPALSIVPIPQIVKEQAREFSALGKRQYAKRREQGTEPNDLFSHLLSPDKDGKVTREVDLEADSPTIIIAGSDTSSITMTFLFYFLARDTQVYARLRDEIDSAWDGNSLLEGYMVGPEMCPYLNGAIYESLRIMPPGPNHMQRMTGPEGHVVDGTPIPPFTQVGSNTITLHHDPQNFTEPMAFVPERWNDSTRDPSWSHDVRAFIPFTGGTFSCAGRALALLEIRLFTVKLMRRFDFTMAKDFDHEKFMGAVRCYQSLIKGPLPLTVKARE